jgi:hypothetical protein
MALTDLLYRCPRCGRDPLPGVGDRAECPECFTTYTRGSVGSRIRISFPGGSPAEVPPHVLTARIDALGGALPGEHGEGGEVRRTPVRMQRSRNEEAVEWDGALVGFVETYEPPEEGVLRLTVDTLEFLDPGGRLLASWGLTTLTAVQGASSAVQIRLPGGWLHQFRFPMDSPRRWESLLRVLVSRARLQAGLGEVVEFQPRITSR